MEIALLNNNSLRVKGKHGSLIVNPSGKAIDADGFIALDGFEVDPQKMVEDSLVIKGPGEYEFGGIKVTGSRYSNDMIYNIRVDRINILLGKAEIIEREHSKLSEYNIVVLYNHVASDPSFVTSLASNVAIFYGDKALDTIKLLAKEGYRKELRYSVSFEKLPQEIEKILLAN